MKIKNNRNNFVNLQFLDGTRSRNWKIGPKQVVNIPNLRNIDQVVNKFLFSIKNIEIVSEAVETPAPVAPKKEEKKEEKKKKTTKKKSSKKADKKTSKLSEIDKKVKDYEEGDTDSKED